MDEARLAPRSRELAPQMWKRLQSYRIRKEGTGERLPFICKIRTICATVSVASKTPKARFRSRLAGREPPGADAIVRWTLRRGDERLKGRLGGHQQLVAQHRPVASTFLT